MLSAETLLTIREALREERRRWVKAASLRGNRDRRSQDYFNRMISRIDFALAEIDAGAGEVVETPQPDWTNAPEWAQWWAVDADGRACWFEAEPVIDDDMDESWNNVFGTRYETHETYQENWKQLKAQRPAQGAKEGEGHA